jgi:hypothetical protein
MRRLAPQARRRFTHLKVEYFGFLQKGIVMEKTSKCPVCDWEIKDGGINVQVEGKEVTVCCEECADKAKKG